MPVTFSSRRANAERQVQFLLDWTRRIMQISIVSTAVLGGYVLYGLLFGAVAQWSALSASEHLRITQNIQGALTYLNVSLGVLLLTNSILYYDEEATGYMMVAGAVFFYFGIPFLMSQVIPGQVETWEQTRNVAALAVLRQLRVAGLLMAIPGGILLVRDVILRIADGGRRKRDQFSAMQFGGSVKEEAPVGRAPIGVLAACWQLPFCRDAIRRLCPIYHARTRCWRQRVGCMCEERVIRHATDALINKVDITRENPRPRTPADDLIEGLAPSVAVESPPISQKTEELPSRAPVPPPNRKQVKIPHNPSLSMAAKRERCRNCVIYNEHQRLKYQFVAPLVVLGVPALAYWQLDWITTTLKVFLSRIDQLMARVSLDPNAQNLGLATSITSTSTVAEYLIIGCIVVIATTMALRWLEYLIFKAKI